MELHYAVSEGSEKEKMEKNKMVFGMEMVLAVLMALTVSVTAAAASEVNFVPDPSSALAGETTNVSIWLDSTEGVFSFDAEIHFDPTVVNITNASVGDFPTGFGMGHYGNYVVLGGVTQDFNDLSAGHWLLANLTLEAKNAGTSPLNFNPSETYLGNQSGKHVPATWHNGTFTVLEQPDLNITEKSEEWVSLADKTYNVTYTVKNNGTAEACASNTSIKIDGTEEATDSVPELVAGASYTATVGPFTMSGDTDTILVCADKDNAVSESDETNNCMENVFECLSAPQLVTYTISNTTITPPQTTEIDVEFSERVEAWIKIEDSDRNLVNDLYHSPGVTDPDPKTWDGTYTDGTQVPDGNYYVNVTGLNTTTGLSVVNDTETITVTSAGAPDIISFAPASPVSDTEGATRTFNITVNQIVNVSWYINGTPVQYNNTDGVTEASYTNDSAVIGTWNVSAIASNTNGSDMQTWIWKVIEAGAAPTADNFGVEDASGRAGTYVEVPVNITNVMNGPILGIRLRVDYNESVLNLTNIDKGDLTSDWTDLRLGEDRHTMVIATAYIGDAILYGNSGSVVLLNFSVVGSPRDTSPMNMTLIELSNPEGVVGTAPAKNGTFRVSKFGAIVGRITYTCNETGIAGAVVNLTKEGAVINTTVTNATGYYNFTEVIPGSYFVNASKPRFWDNSTEVTVIAGETATADMMLWLKGDLNGDGYIADAGDVVLMLRASVGDISGDMRYDLNGNGEIADAGDVVLMLRASVGDIELL